MNSDQVISLVRLVGKQGTAGAIAAARRDFVRGGKRTDFLPGEAAFLDAVANATPEAKPAVYKHPRDAAAIVHRRQFSFSDSGRREKTEPRSLTPSELAWLNRLSSDPKQVPFSDAASLFRLLDDVSDQADRRLLESHLAPVREYHDRQAAKVALANARRPLTEIPAATLQVLAGAIGAENSQLTPNEALTRASKMISEVSQERIDAQGAEYAAAQDQLDAVDAAMKARTAVHA